MRRFVQILLLICFFMTPVCSFAAPVRKEYNKNFPYDCESEYSTPSLLESKIEKAEKDFDGEIDYSPDGNVDCSFFGNGDTEKPAEDTDIIPKDRDESVVKAKKYYNKGMLSDSKKILKGVVGKDADELRAKINRDDAIIFTPNYSFFIQTLDENAKLDYHKFGMNVSKNIENNLTVFGEYNIYVYSSGQVGPGHSNQLNNVVNEVKGGVFGRPKDKIEFRSDFGCKFYEFGGGMLITDSWLKYRFTDSFNLKLGVKRENVEQSYLAAVGFPMDGTFTGRAVNNKLYLDFDARLPHDFYSYGRVGGGIITAQNMETNPYVEGMLALGKMVYNNPKNKWIKTVNLDFVTYNSSYKYNLLDIRDSTGEVFRGYFSPGFFTANTVNIKAEGEIKKWRMRYGIKGFAGVQNAIRPNQTNLAWSFSPYLAYDLNDHVTFNASYLFLNYADIQRHLFMVNAVIRGFNKSKK